MIWKIFMYLFLLNNALSVYSQQIKIQTKIDTNKILIGDQINYSIKLFPDRNERVILPAFNDSLGKFLIVSKSKIDTIIENKTRILSQNIVLTIFDSGVYIIPGLEFGFIAGTDTSFLLSDNFSVQVSSIPVDTTKPIKDIKPILDYPISLMDYLWYFVIGLLAIAIFFVIYYLIKKWKPSVKEVLPYDPKIPAHVQALKDLNELERQKLWQKGYVKEYYIRISDILRLYLERRFMFPAMESTTSEILEYFTQLISSAEITKQLKSVLELSDLVKFAKVIPTSEDNTNMLDAARNIVQSTVPIDNDDNKETK